ncbi:hypothetical protein Tco_0117672 [Tanacetum coccineum]
MELKLPGLIVDWNGADQYQAYHGKQSYAAMYMIWQTMAIFDVAFLRNGFHDSYKLATWKAIGRPPKKRKKSKGEIVMVKGNKLTRQGKTVTCSLCHAAGHNKRSCDRRQPSQGGTSNAAGVGTQPSEGGTSNAAGVGPQASQGGTSNAAGVGTQASQGGTSNAAGTKRKSKEIIDLSSSIEAQIDGSEPGNEGSFNAPSSHLWYGYVDILEYFEDDAYWDSYSPTTDEKEVTLGKYIPNGKHATARPIIKSEAFQTGVVLGVANPKT